MATPMNEDLWKDGIPPYVEDNSKGYREYVDRIAKRVDEWIKSGGGSGDEPNWSWVKNDGKSHFIFEINDEEQLTQQLTFCVPNGKMNWGDGDSDVTLQEETNIIHLHTFPALGTYDVWVEGMTQMTVPFLGTYSAETEEARAALRKVELYITPVSNIAMNGDIFTDCHYLQYVAINGPSKLILKNNCFKNCYQLKYVKLYVDIELSSTTGNGAFKYCWDLESIEGDVTLQVGDKANNQGGNTAFYDCHNLKAVPENTIWNFMGGGTYTSSCINANYALRDLNLVTNRTDTNVGKYGGWCYSNIYHLKNLTLSEKAVSIAANAFNNVRFENLYVPVATPPTLANTTTALQLIDPNAVIHVPKGSLEAYQVATNWATWADNIVDDIPVGGE